MCFCETLPPYDPTSLTEDFVNCSCSRGRGSLVETLPLGKEFDSMDDLEYFKRKVWTSLKVPAWYQTLDLPAPTNVSECTRKPYIDNIMEMMSEESRAR